MKISIDRNFISEFYKYIFFLSDGIKFVKNYQFEPHSIFLYIDIDDFESSRLVSCLLDFTITDRICLKL